MKSSYVAALKFTLQFEGGWSDHPRDPGGATMKGVTIGTYSAFKGRPVTKTELRNIPDADLQAIYRRNYWDAVAGDTRPAGYDAAMFDYAVNSGPARARRYDAAIPAAITGAARIKRLCAARLGFLRGLSTFDVFGKGWTRRVVACEALALRLAGEGSAGLIAEARASDARARTAGGSAGAGAAVTGGSVVLPPAPLAEISPWVTGGIIALVLAGVALLAFKAWQQNTRAEAMRDEAWNG